MHDFLLYDFNLCYNLMKKSLVEHTMAYKKFVKLTKNLSNSFRYCKKLKNSDIQTSEWSKNIKESDHYLEIIETKQYIYIYMTKK